MCTNPNPFWRSALLAGLIGAPLVILGAHSGAQEIRDRAAHPDVDQVHVRGTVLDPQGHPLAGARVCANPNWSQVVDPSLPHIIATTTTNADGRFDLTFKKSAASVFNHSTGRSGEELWKQTRIVAAADGFGLDWKQFDRTDADGQLLLHLVVDELIEGRVIDLEGRPISSVAVKVTGVSSYISAFRSGNSNDWKARPPNAEDGLPFPEEFAARNTPIVTGPDGRFRVAGMGRERTLSMSLQSAKVSESITVLIRRIQPIIQTPWGPTNEKVVTYGSTFELPASPAMVIEGTVRDASTRMPIAGAKVESRHREVSALSNAQGHYRLEGVHKYPGLKENVIVTCDDQPYISNPYVDVPNVPGFGPVNLDIDLHRGVWVTGKVTDGVSRAPVPAYVAYWPAASNKATAAVELFKGVVGSPSYAMTAPDGFYRLVALPGAGVITASSATGLYRKGVGFDHIKDISPQGQVLKLATPFVNSDMENAIREVDLPAAGASDPVDFKLDPGQTLRIVCVDPVGKPLDGLSVRGPNSGYYPGGYQPVEGNVFEATAFAPNERRVMQIYNRQKTLGRVITPRISDFPSQKMTVTLEPLAQVTGRLLDADGDVIQRGMILAEMKPEPRMPTDSGPVSVNVGDDGRFKLELPTGIDWTVNASDMAGRYKSVIIARLPPTPGKTENIGDFRLQKTLGE